MNKQQQIEEIKKVIISVYGRIRTGGEDFLNNRQAEALYNAGYRLEATLTYDFIKMVQKQAVKEFAARLKKDPRINNYGLEFVALVDIDAELKSLLKEYESGK